MESNNLYARATGVLSLFALLLTLFSPTDVSAAQKHKKCRPATIPVALAAGLPKHHRVAGTLCVPSYHRQTVVDVLIHGATYDRDYWNFLVDYPQYSYVQRTLDARGNQRAVFFYDRLGTGRSSRPPSTEVTMDTDAYVLHQVIDWLGRDKRYREINLIGHSFGSLLAIQVAAQYGGIDRLVVTGLLHSIGPAIANGELQQYPAEQDPQFTGKGYDMGYLTSVPDTRQAFYDVTTADPDVIEHDEATKDVASSAQLAQGRAQRTAPAGTNLSNQIYGIPVFVIDGAQDRLYCGLQLDCTNVEAVRAFETPYYNNARSLEVHTIPNTGHDVALHPSADELFAKIDRWLRTTPPAR